MDYQQIQLHISQVQRAILECENSFAEPGKQKIYDNHIAIFNKIKNAEIKKLAPDILEFIRDIINIVFFGVEHLDHSDQVQLLFLLKDVLKDWLPNNPNDYYIVMSYNGSLDKFEVRAWDEERLNNIYKPLIRTLYGEKYEQLLIQVSKPKFLIDDFLGSVPVYHEIGHFIDKNYQITFDIYAKDQVFLQHLKIKDGNGDVNPARIQKAYYHYSEHFCDIFAAQYVGRSILESLNYSFYNAPDSFTHPLEPTQSQ